MTIQELETKTGLTRANIRYYEKEGLLNVERLENGYRNYSEENAQDLKKIILLRKLHFSIEEIKNLIEDEEAFEELIKAKQEELHGQAEEIIYAQEICKDILEKHVRYKSLDSEYYLNQFKEKPSQEQQEQIEEKDVIKTPGHPWRRYFAFALDLAIYSLAVDFVLYNMMSLYPPKSSFVSYTLTFLMYVFMIPLDSILMAKFGTTIGKYLFGIRVTHESGRNLTFSEAFLRNFYRLRYGEGFTIPFYSLYRNWKCYQACSDGKTMKWDEEVSYEIEEIKAKGYIVFITAYILVMVLGIGVNIMSLFPKQTNDGTVGTFVKNYNDMLRHVFNVNSAYLDNNGYIHKHNTYTIGKISIGDGTGPIKIFDFVQKDGKLYEIKSNKKADPIEMETIYSRYIPIGLYTIAASQEEFHFWDYSKVEAFLSNYENNFKMDSYQDSFKNIELYHETKKMDDMNREINMSITIN